MPLSEQGLAIKNDINSFIDFSFALIVDHMNATYFACIVYMSAAIGLEIKSLDLNSTDFYDPFGQKIDLCTDQIRDLKGFIGW